MQRILLLILALNISVVITKNLMIVGFQNYKFDQSAKTIKFEVLLKKPNNFQKYTYLNFGAEVSNSSSTNNYSLNCSLNTTYQNEENDLSYNCLCDNISLQNINKVAVMKNFTFSNSTQTINLNSDKQIYLSSLAKQTINNITTQTGYLKYKTFTLKNVSLNGNEYTLTGQLDIGSSSENVSLALVKYNFTCLVSNTSIKINMSPDDSIVDILNGKIMNRTNGNKILIDSNDTYDLIVYPILSLSNFIELIGFGDLNSSTISRNATAKAYFRGPYVALYNLKDYLKFTAKIKFSNRTENITAYGIENESIDSKNWIITYDIVFPNTENKTIESLTIQKDFEFSDDPNFSKTDDLSIIYPDVICQSFNLNNFKTLDPERPDEISLTYTNSNFSFHVPLNNIIDNQAPIYLSYIPYNKDKKENGKKREEINCKILNRSNTYEYTLKCYSAKSFFTFINTLEFIVNSKNVKSRLRFLENNENITYAFTPDAGGNLSYISNEESKDYISFIELLGIGAFNSSTISRNATAKAYFRGPYVALYNLKDYLKFTATIQFSNIYENIISIGTKNDTNVEKEIAIYDIVFPNTENKTIKSLTIQKDFEFSDDPNFSKTDDLSIIYPAVISQSFEESDFQVLKIPSEQEGSKVFNNKNISLVFNFPDSIVNQTKTYLSYIPYNKSIQKNQNKREEISDCNIYTQSNSKEYTIKCYPKKSFITYINTLKFIVNSTNVKRRLRFLQSTKNKTYAASADATGNITYNYEGKFIDRNNSSKGLSAGGIVAIVLVTVAAILAAGIVFYFLSRKTPLPPNKNIVSKISDSTTKIN